MSVTTFDSVAKFVSQYHQSARHPSLPELTVSGLYDLFPDEGGNQTVVGRWPKDDYPNHRSAGVYVIVAADLEVLYVGKASASNNIGGRLAGYFSYERPGMRCNVIHSNWSQRPRYVATIAVQEPYEAPSLEEFLIDRLRPRDNTHGNRRSSFDGVESIG